MKKHGLELEVEFNKTTATQLNYWVKGIFGYNENRIISKTTRRTLPNIRRKQENHWEPS